MKLDDVLRRLGLVGDDAFEIVQFRTLGDPEAGGAADLERIEEADRTVVVVSLWRWTHGPEGSDRDREGQLVFDATTGVLLDGGQGDPEAIVEAIAAMTRLEG